MAKNTFTAWTKKYQLNLFAGLFVSILAVGFVYWHQSANQPQPLSSQASEENPAPHWPHQSLPFKLSLLNSSSRYWSQHLTKAMKNWEQSPVLTYNIIPAQANQACDFYAEMADFCTYYEDDGTSASGGLIYWTNTGHIVSAVLAMNDFYLNNPKSQYSTPEWRNYLLCNYMGMVLGLPQRYDEPPESTSCMNGYGYPDRIANQQAPDAQDLADLKVKYNHSDDTSSSAISYKTAQASKAWKQKNYGKLIPSLSKGQQEVRELDLGDGYIMRAILHKASVK